jgi:hypothetical protein
MMAMTMATIHTATTAEARKRLMVITADGSWSACERR